MHILHPVQHAQIKNVTIEYWDILGSPVPVMSKDPATGEKAFKITGVLGGWASLEDLQNRNVDGIKAVQPVYTMSFGSGPSPYVLTEAEMKNLTASIFAKIIQSVPAHQDTSCETNIHQCDFITDMDSYGYPGFVGAEIVNEV